MKLRFGSVLRFSVLYLEVMWYALKDAFFLGLLPSQIGYIDKNVSVLLHQYFELHGSLLMTLSCLELDRRLYHQLVKEIFYTIAFHSIPGEFEIGVN